MDKKYTAVVTFGSTWDDKTGGVGLHLVPFEGCMTWIEDDSDGGPTPVSVVSNINDMEYGMFKATSCRDIREVI